MNATSIEGLDLATATNQDVFDFVVYMLIRQGRAALKGSSCVYRAPDGCKCAVGQLIPDAEYQRRFERESVITVIRNTPSLKAWACTVGAERFLSELQLVHDRPMSGERWFPEFRARARAFAKAHGLDASIVRFREEIVAA